MPHAAVVQLNSSANVKANLETARELLERASQMGAVLAVLPENFAFMGAMENDKFAVAESVEANLSGGPIQSWIAQTARELGMWLIAGTIPSRTRSDNKVAATCLVVDAHGSLVASYDKIHLFDVDIPRDRLTAVSADGIAKSKESYRESATVEAGERVVVVDTPIGRVGLSVCYDVRFPELYRSLQTKGAQVLCVPAAFTVPTGEAHWLTLLRARAIENLCYVLAPGQVGTHASGRHTYGHSVIIDPWGEILAHASEPRIDAVCALIDLSRQTEIRDRFPALRHRRSDLAGDWVIS
jgi:deaminated glutathione amidase